MKTISIWFFSFALYLLFAAAISPNELFTAAALATLTACWCHALRRNCSSRFATGLDEVKPAMRTLRAFFPATWRTAKILFKAIATGSPPDRSRRWDFHYGHPSDPKARYRRALSVLLASVTPDRFVIFVDRKSQKALIHALFQAGHPPDPEWLQ
jgi:hypothetical protein